jgi:polysaccharide pyruvyl transferase WcaK-like protein
MIPTPTNITLIGYYGADNPGDDWLEIQASLLIKKKFPNGTLFHHHAYKKLRTITYILKSNYVMFGGGSLFQDHTSKKSLYYYASLMLLAAFLNKKIILLGHGFSKPESKLSLKLLCYTLKKANRISVRDQKSFDHCLSFGVPKTKLFLASDLAYYNAYPKPEPHIPFIIAARYHTAVWASLRHIPFVALAYDDKMIHLAEELEQPYIDIRHALSEDVFRFTLTHLQKNQKEFQQLLIDALERLLKRSEDIL